MSVKSPSSVAAARPCYILRGHGCALQALRFNKDNSRLISADADGWIILWSLTYKRPTAVWRAHTNAILGVDCWGGGRIITHGRDNRLNIWQLRVDDEVNLDKVLPVDIESDSTGSQRQPWLVYSLSVNALNFCAFAMCSDTMAGTTPSYNTVQIHADAIEEIFDPILLAVPNTIDDGGIDIYQLPSQKRIAMIPARRTITTGMVMCLRIATFGIRILLIAGYESGHTSVYTQSDPGASFESLYFTKAHGQPVLSVAVAPNGDHFITSAADADIIKHPLPLSKSIFPLAQRPLKTVATKHSGQQGISYRSDSRLFTTAGWDSVIRVYSGKSMKELAVLKWHKVACYATALASIHHAQDAPSPLGNDSPQRRHADQSDPKLSHAPKAPPNTDKHQEIMRSASTTVMQSSPENNNDFSVSPILPGDESNPQSFTSGNTLNTDLALDGIQQETLVELPISMRTAREQKACSTHWLAAGAKDGKISLWNIY